MNLSASQDNPPKEQPAWLRWLLVLLLACFAGLFLFTSLARTRRLSADSLNYIDVGRNLARGQGLVQSTLVIARPLQVWDAARTVAPFVSQPPLYPLAIALFGRLGIPFTDAALLISALSFLAALGLSYLIALELYDEVVAWLALAILTLAPHLASLGRLAWSETLGIALVLSSLWLLIRLRRPAASIRLSGLALAAGLSAGFAFAARYALGVLLLAGLIYLWNENRSRLLPRRAFWRLAGLYLAGWLVPVACVLAHNALATGRLFPVNLPADKGLLANFADAFQVLFGGFLSTRLPAPGQFLLAGLFLAGMILAAILRGSPAAYFHERLLGKGRYLLWLWPLIYVGFLVVQRSISFFDELDLRLLAPAAATLILLLAALFSGLFPRRHALYVLGLAAGLLALALWGQFQLLRQPPAPTPDQQIAASPRLSWLAAQTSSRDLVIGDTVNDIPYFFDRQAAVSFSPYPYTILLTPSTLDDLADQYCPSYANLYLVLRKRELSDAKLRQLFGRYVANLWGADPEKYPELELISDLPDSRVFKLKACED